MRIQVSQSSNPSQDKLTVFDPDMEQPLCQIYEDDFCEMIGDKETIKYLKGKYIFNIERRRLYKSRIFNICIGGF